MKKKFPNIYAVKPLVKPKPIKWRKYGKYSYDGVSLNGKYDFNINRENCDEGCIWVIAVFNHTIKKDHDKAYIDSFESDTLEEAKEDAEAYK